MSDQRTVQFYSRSKATHEPQEMGGVYNWRKIISNFWDSPVVYEELLYPSVENAFAAAKYKFAEGKDNPPDLRHLSGADLKRAHSRKGMESHGFVLDVSAWDEARINIMWKLLLERLKSDETFRNILTGLQGYRIMHFERSGRRSFWGGVYKNGAIEGHNMLGHMMMELSDIAVASKALCSLDGV